MKKNKIHFKHEKMTKKNNKGSIFAQTVVQESHGPDKKIPDKQ